MKMKYQGFASPYFPGMMLFIYHVMMLYTTISTTNINHIKPTLMSPLIPLGGSKMFIHVRPTSAPNTDNASKLMIANPSTHARTLSLFQHKNYNTLFRG